MANSFPVFHKFLKGVPLRAIAGSGGQIGCVTVSFNTSLEVRKIHLSKHHNEIYQITGEEDFKNKVMRNSLPVIVNFHADWCEPCHSLKPLLEKIAEENDGRLHLAEVLVDEHVDLLHAFEVTAVPAVLGIHRGIVTEKFVGLVSHKQVLEFVNKLLEKSPKS